MAVKNVPGFIHLQLDMFECTHVVREECFSTVEDCWSPYFVRQCIKCGTIFGNPDEDWLKTWPQRSQDRLREFING